MSRKNDQHLTVTGRFRPLFVPPGVASYGTWTQAREAWGAHDREVLRFRAEQAPWRGLFAGLDAEGEQRSDAPVAIFDEADAIMACCWRYGSYANVLTAGELCPEFAANANLSRIDDDEMMRINIEFSAGVAAWWADRETDPGRVRRPVRAALKLLPMPWRKGRGDWCEMAVTMDLDEVASKLREITPMIPQCYTAPEWRERCSREITLREEANCMVNSSYRNNNPIENYHAGTGCFAGDVPGFLRLYAGEIDQVCRPAVRAFARWLAIRDHLDAQRERHALWGLAAGLFIWPHDWNESQETSPISFLASYEGRSILPRLRWLAERYPSIYGSAGLLGA